MSLDLRPVRIATGFDEEGMLVFGEDERLLAVLTHLSHGHGDLSGRWFLETAFGRLARAGHPTFADLIQRCCITPGLAAQPHVIVSRR